MPGLFATNVSFFCLLPQLRRFVPASRRANRTGLKLCQVASIEGGTRDEPGSRANHTRTMMNTEYGGAKAEVAEKVHLGRDWTQRWFAAEDVFRHPNSAQGS